jgi:hypothetical protein
MKNLKPVIEPLLKKFKEEKIVGLIKFKFSMPGNQEPIEFEIEREINRIAFRQGFIINKVYVMYDGDCFSKVFIYCYDIETIFEHLQILESAKSNDVLLGALNRAIIMLDDYNNMFGDKMDKTLEISGLDIVLKMQKK